jgi:hypothetical protein
MSGAAENIRQQAAEETVEQAELDSVLDLDDVDRDAALAQLRHEPEDDQVIPWRRAS